MDEPYPGAHLLAASDRDRAAAIFANQTAWIMELAQARGGDVWRSGALRVARWPDGGAVLLSPGAPLAGANLDAALAWFRAASPAEGILFWAMDDCDGTALLARGCDPAFRPHWMWRDLGDVAPCGASGVAGVTIRVATMADRAAIAGASSVPYAHPEGTTAILQMAERPPAARSAWLLIADYAEGDRLGRRRVIGRAALFLPANGFRVAGIFDVGVAQDARRQGVGQALVRAACIIARDHGAVVAGLNATPEGERLYRRLGFVSAGYGQTWLLPAERLPATAQTATIAFAEALAAGDLVAVDRAAGDDLLRAPLLNGDSPLAFAARAGQKKVGRWLLARGVAPEIVPLWALGLRDDALVAMRDPVRREARIGPTFGTPLHEAVRRNDPELVHALVAAGADRSATDATWHSTAAGWARALGHDDLLPLLTPGARGS